ncbi:Uncharacterized protein Fot_29635 [Forsythia ovata]|uniref:Probable purine permease n=1 Tax=Forsythia ovata TaxID=205694 RepID=A0ABD1TSG0_9LAMI
MESESSTTWKKTFLVLNCILVTLGNCGGPLIIRLYFIKGGKRIWLSSFIQTAVATQLGFTAGFAYLLVKQKFTVFSINAIVLLTAGAAVLALHTSGDRPEGVSKKEYALGFIFTLVATALAGFIMPFLEFTYLKAKQTVTYTMVLEIQLVMGFFATAFCTVGMIINKDFQFQTEKGVALFLSLWGFVSYFFGERKQSKKNIHQTQETEIVRASWLLRRDIQVTNSSSRQKYQLTRMRMDAATNTMTSFVIWEIVSSQQCQLTRMDADTNTMTSFVLWENFLVNKKIRSRGRVMGGAVDLYADSGDGNYIHASNWDFSEVPNN